MDSEGTSREGRLSGATSGPPGIYGFWLGRRCELSVERVSVAHEFELCQCERGLERPRPLALKVPEGTFA